MSGEIHVKAASAPARRPVGESAETPAREPVTLRTIRRMVQRGERFACLTCYDATTARWLERAGVHVLLVGDTAAEVVLGFPRTIDMPLDVALALTAGVKRGAPSTMVMGDMPFMTYQADEADALRNAARFMTEGLADIVKVEADASFAPLVGKMARAGIPVCAHVGVRPQRVALSGGYSAAGRTADAAVELLEDARTLEEAGAVMLLVEATPAEVAGRIVRASRVPVIGIGVGADEEGEAATPCHGEVLVLQDLLGLSENPPRFAAPVASMGPMVQRAGEEWVRRVRSNRIGGEGYSMRPGERDKLEGRLDAGDRAAGAGPLADR